MWRGKWIQLFLLMIFRSHFCMCRLLILFWKIINTKNYHFCTIQISQTRMQNVRFSYMPPTCESMKMTHTKIRTFRTKHKGCSAIVPVGCSCLMELFLCSYPEGIQYPQDISAVSIVVLFLWSSRSPIWFLLYKLLRVSLILHRWCSFVLVLILVFLRRCRSLSIVLCPVVLSCVFPISDMFLRCTRTCYIHMGCCSIHMSSYHLTGSLLLTWDLWLSFTTKKPTLTSQSRRNQTT